MRIRFISTVQAETEGRHKGPVYKAGTELDLSEPSAMRWLRRGVAVEATTAASRPMAAVREPEKPEPLKAEEPKAAEPAPKRRGRKRGDA